MYKNAEYWKDFKNIRPIPGTAINTISIETVDLSSYKTVEAPISMLYDNEIIAFQCDVELSEGAEVVKNERGKYDVTLSDRSNDSHSVMSKEADGGIRILAYSSNNEAFTGNEGALFSYQQSPKIVHDCHDF